MNSDKRAVGRARTRLRRGLTRKLKLEMNKDKMTHEKFTIETMFILERIDSILSVYPELNEFVESFNKTVKEHLDEINQRTEPNN